jgi:hypothetical protein
MGGALEGVATPIVVVTSASIFTMALVYPDIAPTVMDIMSVVVTVSEKLRASQGSKTGSISQVALDDRGGVLMRSLNVGVVHVWVGLNSDCEQRHNQNSKGCCYLPHLSLNKVC